MIETLMVAPDMFDAYVAMSPSLWWNGSAIPRGYAAWRAKTPALKKTLYLTVAGDDDRNDAIAAFAASLRADRPASMTFLFEPRPAEHHDTIYRASEAAALRATFAAKP